MFTEVFSELVRLSNCFECTPVEPATSCLSCSATMNTETQNDLGLKKS